MAQCTNCGQELAQGASSCASCGTPVAVAAPPAAPGAAEASTASGPVPRDARNMAVLLHLSAFIGYVIPFGHIGGPLLIWLLKREDSPFIDFHGKEALNFQISMTIYLIISSILILVVIGILLVIGLVLLWVIAVIIVAVRAGNGQEARYPLRIRFIK